MSTQRTTGMTRRAGSTQWQQRIMIPTWARPLYDGKAFIRFSLRTSDAAEARRKSLKLLAEWADRFESQRHLAAPPTVTGMTPDMQAYLCAAVRHRILDADDALRFSPTAVRAVLEPFEGLLGTARYFTADHPPADYLTEFSPDGLTPSQLARFKVIEAAMVGDLQASLAMGRTSAGRVFADAEAERLGLAFDWDKHRPALVAISRAVVSAYLEAAKRSHGDPVQTPDLPEIPESAVNARVAALPAPQSAKAKRSLYDVAEEWKVGVKAKPDALGKTMRAVRLLEDSGQSVLLSDLNKSAGLRWRIWLRDEARPFGENTAGKHFQAIMALLNYATDQMDGWLDKNPWKGIEAPKGRAAKRIPWDLETLRRLFASPLFQNYALPDDARGGGDAAYWCPLLALYSGARLAEMGNLRLVDVVSRDGVMLIDINEALTTKKSDAGVRTVPIHSTLIHLGFADYVEAKRAKGGTMLFDLYVQPSRTGPTYFSDWFRDYRTAQGCDTRWQDFHAMRTTVSTKLRGVHPALSESLILALLGHEATNTGQAHYTVFDPRALQRAIELLEFPGLDLPRVYPTPSGD